MNAPPLKKTVSSRVPDKDTWQDWLLRTCHPVLKGARDLVNSLSQNNITTVTASGRIDISSDVVLADATAGNLTLALPPAALWERRILVIKADASAHTVTVTGSVVAITLLARYDVAEVASDGIQYYPVSSTLTLGGDVTGSASNNTVSKLQTVPLLVGTPNKGDILEYDGTQITMVTPRARIFDNSYTPVANWNFSAGAGVGPIDISGNGFNLSTETGTARYSGLTTTLGGVLFDGAFNFVLSSFQATLALLGAMECLILGMWSDLPAGGSQRVYISHGAPGETSDTNDLYQLGVDASNQVQYIHEDGAGNNDTFSNNSWSPRFQTSLMGFHRSSGGVITFSFNGIDFGTPSGSLTLPTDGTSGRLRIGASNNDDFFFMGVLSGVVLYSRELTAAERLERYNYTLGRAYGMRG